MLSALFDIVVQPIIYVIELAFSIMYQLSKSPGISIVGVSIVVNVLCLPLYKMADDAQEREREKQASMARWVAHIKKHFKGDEQYMMLSTYYDQQGYHPTRALIGSLPLLLQIPFFMAAYTYLSHLALLDGASFLFLSNLGAPDALLQLPGGLALNVMPIAMTAINCASTAVYTRGLPLRDKLQAYVLAALFLVLLYDSPSGLVFYWTCNQLFSLGKNVVMKFLSSRSGAKAEEERPQEHAVSKAARRATIAQFFLGAALLAALVGLLVPSAVIGDSPTEFVNVHAYEDPMQLIVHSLCVWAGLLVLWLGIYFLLSDQAGRRKMALVVWCLCGAALVGYFVFKPDFGTLSTSLIYDEDVVWGAKDMLVNLAVLAAVTVALVLLWKKANGIVAPVLGVLLVAIVGLSIPNVANTRTQVDELMASSANADTELFTAQGEPKPLFSLSRNGKNVMVIFMDRALSGMLPYIFDERPELEAKFDGFTYYPNTLSFGRITNYGAPALYGGYEYTPQAMDERDDQLLADKHDEALLLMPTLFSEAGYQTTVVDPPYAKYHIPSDLTLYDGMQNTKAYALAGAYTAQVRQEYGLPPLVDKRSFFFYGLFRVAPRALQRPIYNRGRYRAPSDNASPNQTFLNDWSVLHELPKITNIAEDGNNFFLFCNDTTHSPDFLALPNYEPAPAVSHNVTEPTTRVHDGKTMLVDTPTRCKHYHVNATMYLQLARWFDWLREQGVYDNTRIIIVADHGRELDQFEGQTIDENLHVEMVNPLFMVKDFNAHGFSTSNEFMTNGDTPTIALDGVVQDPVNPFTGNAINSDEKTAHEQQVTISENWMVNENNGYKFDSSDLPWYAVHDNIFDMGNWRRLDK